MLIIATKTSVAQIFSGQIKNKVWYVDEGINPKHIQDLRGLDEGIISPKYGLILNVDEGINPIKITDFVYRSPIKAISDNKGHVWFYNEYTKELINEFPHDTINDKGALTIDNETKNQMLFANGKWIAIDTTPNTFNTKISDSLTRPVLLKSSMKVYKKIDRKVNLLPITIKYNDSTYKAFNLEQYRFIALELTEKKKLQVENGLLKSYVENAEGMIYFTDQESRKKDSIINILKNTDSLKTAQYDLLSDYHNKTVAIQNKEIKSLKRKNTFLKFLSGAFLAGVTYVIITK